MLKAFGLSGLRTKRGLNVTDQPVLVFIKLFLKAQLKKARQASKIKK